MADPFPLAHFRDNTDHQIALLESLQELVTEIDTFNLYQEGINPADVPPELRMHAVADEQLEIMDVAESTIANLGLYSDIISPDESRFAVYYLNTLLICNAAHHYAQLNHNLAKHIKRGVSFDAALEQLPAHTKLSTETIDSRFEQDAVAYGLKPGQAQFVLNFVRNQTPLPVFAL